MIEKNRFYSELDDSERKVADAYLRSELIGLPSRHPIRILFCNAWRAYQNDKFTYDGATFVKERHRRTLFEVAALIHDWRNSNGCVGVKADREMFDIMIRLNYPLPLIVRRWFFCRLTFANVLRHKLKRTYRKVAPKDLYKLTDY